MNALPMVHLGKGLFQVQPGHVRRAESLYGAGECVNMVEQEMRSPASHKAFFASVNEIWKSLPDEMSERFPTADSLRKEALKATGWCDTITEVCGSNAEARRWAERIRKYMPADAYPTITVSGCAVVVITAKSQAVRAMQPKDFRASADAVLRFLAERLGVQPGQVPTTEAA